MKKSAKNIELLRVGKQRNKKREVFCVLREQQHKN